MAPFIVLSALIFIGWVVVTVTVRNIDHPVPVSAVEWRQCALVGHDTKSARDSQADSCTLTKMFFESSQDVGIPLNLLESASPNEALFSLT